MSRHGEHLRSTLIRSCFLVVLLALVLATPAQAALKMFRIPQHGAESSGDGVQSLITGPDGAIWFTESRAGRIGRITTSGKLSEFRIPAAPSEIIAGPDRALWFTGYFDDQSDGYGKIGRLSTAGGFTVLKVPPETRWPGEGLPIDDITLGPDGALWFAQATDARIVRVTTSGRTSTFATGLMNSFTLAIATGPDGALWFTPGDQLGRLTTSGRVRHFEVESYMDGVRTITTGPDGAVWMIGNGDIVRVAPSGKLRHFRLPRRSGGSSITAGPDGALWFTEAGAKRRIGRLTTSGKLTQISIPHPGAGLREITTGPDGALWFTSSGELQDYVGRITLPPKSVARGKAEAALVRRFGRAYENGRGTRLFCSQRSSKTYRCAYGFSYRGKRHTGALKVRIP